MTTTRRNFLKKACISGICLCGFSTILGSETFTPKTPSSETPNKNEIMFLKWITELLENLENSHLTEAQLRQIVKSSSIAHHHNLEMDTMLTPFKGHLDNFIEFIEEFKEIDKIDMSIKNYENEILTLKGLRNCPKCGEPFNIDFEFCPKCGYKQGEE